MFGKKSALVGVSLVILAFAHTPASAQEMERLNMLWEVQVNGTDYMTTANATERDSYALRGAVAYVPANNISGTAAV